MCCYTHVVMTLDVLKHKFCLLAAPRTLWREAPGHPSDMSAQGLESE